MSDNPLKRFAGYSNADLAQLVQELARADDERLVRVLAEVRNEIERRRDSQGPAPSRKLEWRLHRRRPVEQ
jgi:hypothetical protein